MQTDFTPNYTEQKPRSNRLVLISLAVLVLLICFGFVVKHLNEDKVLTIEPAPGYTISVGTPTAGENGLGISKLLAKTTSFQRLRLKGGYYVALFAKNSDYTPIYQNVDLSHNLTLIPPVLYYTPHKLSALLTQQSSAIQAAFQNSSSGSLLSQGYAIQNTGLYQDGSWYAGKLIPSNSAQDDILVFVMHQQSAQWKLVAGPAITLYIGDYLNVPSSVIRAANVSPLNSSLPY
jgi:hypothetical protein